MATGRFAPWDKPQPAAGDFAADASRIGSFTLDLSVAREKERIAVGGSVIWCYEATDANTNARIGFRRDTQSDILFKRGSYLGGAKFKEIYVTNTVQSGKSMEFLYTVGDIGGKVDIGNYAGQISIGEDFQKANTLSLSQVTVTNTATSLGSADSDARELLLHNTSSEPVYVGDSGVTASTGIPLDPDTTMSIVAMAQSEIYAIRSTSGNSAINVLKGTRS